MEREKYFEATEFKNIKELIRGCGKQIQRKTSFCYQT